MSEEKSNNSAVNFQVSRRLARQSCLQFLYQCDQVENWEPGEEEIAVFWESLMEDEEGEKQELARSTRSYAEKTLKGILENQQKIDSEIERIAENWKLNRMGIIDRNILRIAFYEILFIEKIPPKTSINEAVELAKIFGDKETSRFVNGLLDRLINEQKK